MAEPQETDKQFAGEPSSALKASTSESTAGSTTIILFDGKGGDPTTLVDREVQCYYENEESTRLEFKCSDGRLQFHKEGVTENWDLDDDNDEDFRLRSPIQRTVQNRCNQTQAECQTRVASHFP